MSEEHIINSNVYSITNDLRKELDAKIENTKKEIKERLPKYVFIWAVSVLVFIIGIFYALSYTDVLEWRKESMKIIYMIENNNSTNKSPQKSS